MLHHLPELAQTHVHQVGDAIQPKTKVGLPFYFPCFQVLPTGSIQELPGSIRETVHFHDESVQSQNFPDSPAFIWPVKTLAVIAANNEGGKRAFVARTSFRSMLALSMVERP